MKVRMTGLVLVFLLGLTFSSAYAYPEPGYFPQLGKTFARGVKNLVSFSWEIPSTIKQYDGKMDGNFRVFRDMAGFVDGTFRSLTRLGCGFWDIAFSFVPGQQDGLPLKPEAFF